MARYDFSEDRETARVELTLLRCEHEPCGRVWQRAQRPGPAPRYCSDACKTAHHREVRKLDAAARRAHKAAQERRRRAWVSHEAAQWRNAERRRRGPAAVDELTTTASRLTRDLERLARAIVAAQTRPGAAADREVQDLHHRFTVLQDAAIRQTEQMSNAMTDLDASLQLVRLQLGGLLTGGETDR